MGKNARFAGLWGMVGLVIPLGLTLVALAGGGMAPAGTLLAITLIAGAAVLGGLVETRNARFSAPPAAIGPQTVHVAPEPLGPYSLHVVRDQSAPCPLGYHVGEEWTVDGDGTLSRPLCIPAVLAAHRLTSSITERRIEPKAGKTALCHCPWARATLRFEARPRNVARAA